MMSVVEPNEFVYQVIGVFGVQKKELLCREGKRDERSNYVNGGGGGKR
jgi:hypothetical protein